MLKRTTLINALLAIFLLQALPLSAADGHYRWKDENGKLHYSDRPPAGVDAEFVEFATGRSTRVEAEPEAEAEENTTQAPATEEAPAEPQQPMKIEVEPGKDPALCEQAKANLAALSKPKVRITEADGTKRLLTKDEKEAEMARARKFMGVYCE